MTFPTDVVALRDKQVLQVSRQRLAEITIERSDGSAHCPTRYGKRERSGRSASRCPTAADATRRCRAFSAP